MEKKRSKQKLKLAAKKPQKALESIWRLEDKGAGPSGVELEPGGGRDEDPVSKQQTKLASQTFPPPPLSLPSFLFRAVRLCGLSKPRA